MDAITDLAALRAHFGTVSALAETKVLPFLDEHSRRFIALSPFLVLATTDGAGAVDASPRGDPPGFVAVLDSTTLLLPDRPGNRRVDSYGNVVAHGGVALLFFVPGITETLRVNGTARVVSGGEKLDALSEQGKRPVAGLIVKVEEAFFHCGKALIRSRLWDADSRVARSDFPSLGRIIADQIRTVEAAEADRIVEYAYRTTLY